MVLTVMFTLLLAALVVVLAIQWQRGRNPQTMSAARASQYVQGTLTVVGVSDNQSDPRSATDRDGQRFYTITGTIVGPETTPTEVYGTLVLGPDDPWPQVGDDLPVIYKPHKAVTSWQFGVLPDPQPPLGA
ncbi:MULTISPECIES: hypothetical protein [Mycobacteriales]|uniref:hypothetical protein n=1 Tax=Mycobacteriales TaxID=85007 RepID=UPI0009C48B8B|nr:hypothetical protein [Gordonia sp. YY1]ART90655.1 hypothetical protein [Rhodococcus rhodochrous]KAF0969024.1 hypothetical protein BPODLACK_02254 [Gordonia sp. YY1]OOL33142.1 Hypothetical protein GQ85_040 [Rhodococcus rhodochrous]